ncbi:diaminopimelate decarboxylase [Myroides pelagicus]|uniref:Diaminopimelate decarboxylase n=1 Tax=Myroides pelagicus TaxID=270914 RepID=A0A7K1GKK3_9FLAO|nr:diaminopimelate decarboxylase [Myroides pelagicus]MEC4114296.1 diaminopimelate decarboxylase [Myroides pelagicus]MTH29346.1 diaminopimelate decarboxylase [Myroides pelagicus]
MENVREELQNQSTPLYYYDLPLLRETVNVAKNAADRYGYKIHYAIKANNNSRILEEISQLGVGADCVSGAEIALAIEKGFQPAEVVFAGVGKTDKEIQLALENDILAFNVESVQEIGVISEIASSLGKVANIALRINPNVDAKTHHYITTGLDENKFGIMMHELDTCLEIIENHASLSLVGLHFHVGSQITDLNVYKRLCVKVNEWNAYFYDRGYTVPILNLGGGLGINYMEPDEESIVNFSNFFYLFHQFLELKPGQEVHFELGRSIVANCGSLISRVLYIKNGLKKNFAILDAGMTELLRPALYQAYHKVELLQEDKQIEEEEISKVRYDIVGPICESSDCFGKDVLLPELIRGDLIAIRSAGAYGEVMSSRYNLRQPLNYFYKE